MCEGGQTSSHLLSVRNNQAGLYLVSCITLTYSLHIGKSHDLRFSIKNLTCHAETPFREWLF